MMDLVAILLLGCVAASGLSLIFHDPRPRIIWQREWDDKRIAWWNSKLIQGDE